MSRPPSQPSTAGSTVLAFDFGLRRIGVAVGHRSTGTGSPLGVVHVTRKGPDWDAVERLLRDWQPDLLLVGVPGLPDGGEGSFAPHARRFAVELRERFGVAVETADETLTSRAARELLCDERRSGRRTRRVGRGDVDPVAALLILRGWLEAHRGAA
ncbi:MAG: Holliday junction resolvase RuvX [Gammaproteobacteria bacterium]|nr:Holliday junction resolvase RuvX [Gammaproteobacteria bacterium]